MTSPFLQPQTQIYPVRIYLRQGSTREGRRPGSVTPDETGDDIDGAEPQKIR